MWSQEQLEELAELAEYEDIDGWGIGEMVESQIDDDIEIKTIEFTPNIQKSGWDELSKFTLGEIFNLVGIVKLYLDTPQGEKTLSLNGYLSLNLFIMI